MLTRINIILPNPFWDIVRCDEGRWWNLRLETAVATVHLALVLSFMRCKFQVKFKLLNPQKPSKFNYIHDLQSPWQPNSKQYGAVTTRSTTTWHQITELSRNPCTGSTVFGCTQENGNNNQIYDKKKGSWYKSFMRQELQDILNLIPV